MSGLSIGFLLVAGKGARRLNTGQALQRRERELMVNLTSMLPCLARLTVSELTLRTAFTGDEERWELRLVPRPQRVLEQVFVKHRGMEVDAHELWQDLQRADMRVERCARKVRAAIDRAALPFGDADPLRDCLLRAERAKWVIDMEHRQIELNLPGGMRSYREKAPMMVRGLLRSTSVASLLLRCAEFSRLDAPDVVVGRTPRMVVFADPNADHGCRQLLTSMLPQGQLWKAQVHLERSTVSGQVLGGVITNDA